VSQLLLLLPLLLLLFFLLLLSLLLALLLLLLLVLPLLCLPVPALGPTAKHLAGLAIQSAGLNLCAGSDLQTPPGLAPVL